MDEHEDTLLEQFVNLPQLKQVIDDKDDLVKSIEVLASKALPCLYFGRMLWAMNGSLLKLNSGFTLQKKIYSWNLAWKQKDKQY